MKRKISAIIFALVLLAFLIFALYYTRPQTISQLCLGTDVTQSESVRGYYSKGSMEYNAEFEITPDSETFGRLIDLFETRTFKKSLLNLLPLGTKTHSVEDGDFKWELIFRINDVTLSDGTKVTGDLICIDNFYGILEIRFNGTTWRCTTSDKDVWLAEVMALIAPQ